VVLWPIRHPLFTPLDLGPLNGRRLMSNMLEASLGHRFDRPELLDQALTHSSASHLATARTGGARSYERLEFLGDRILGLIIAEMLLAAYPDEAEGALARRHAELVRKETLAAVAGEIDLAQHVRLPLIEEPAASSNPSLLADVCEAVIAALYLDGGFSSARNFISQHWTARMTAALAPPKDPKTALQEWAQGRGRKLPAYRLLKAEGPPHHPIFTVAVEVDGVGEQTATGASKRQAEATAAALLLQQIDKGNS
jgi:ribonuclease-3